MTDNSKSIRSPYISLPNAGSAGEFVKRLAQRIARWREMLPEDREPVILSFLPTGDVVEVLSIGEDGHSSVVIEGMVDDEAPCMFISHQASLQILCYTRKVEEDKDKEKEPKKRTIGFHVDGEEFEA